MPSSSSVEVEVGVEVEIEVGVEVEDFSCCSAWSRSKTKAFDQSRTLN